MKKNLLSLTTLAFTALSSLSISAVLAPRNVYCGSDLEPEKTTEGALRSVNGATQRFLDTHVKTPNELIYWETVTACLWEARRAAASLAQLSQLLLSPEIPSEGSAARLWSLLKKITDAMEIGGALEKGVGVLHTQVSRDWMLTVVDDVFKNPSYINELHTGANIALRRARMALDAQADSQADAAAASDAGGDSEAEDVSND